MNNNKRPHLEPIRLDPEARQLPQDVAAERGILGCILIDPEIIALIADTLRADHFYQEKNQLIYKAMLHLYERQEMPDQHSVMSLLLQREQFEIIGGSVYLGSLVGSALSTSAFERYALRVIRTSILRGAINVGGQIVDLAWNAGDKPAEDVLEQIEGLVYDLSRRECVSDDVESVGEIFDRWFDTTFDLPSTEEGAITGVTSGLRDLDRLLGGFQPSDLIVLCGRPGMGKTSFMLSVALAAARSGQGVFISSLEMSKEQLVSRLVSMIAGINLQALRLRRVTSEERARVIAARSEFETLPIYIDDTPGISLLQLRSKLRREQARHSIDFAIVDYLQLMQATIDGKRLTNRYDEVSEVARGLKNIAKDFNVPVLALSQLSREVEKRADKIPQLSDLRESGEIEQAADIGLAIYRDDVYNPTSERRGQADLHCLKQRNGPVGVVTCGFDATQTRYYDLELTYSDAMIQAEEEVRYGDIETA
jgi:replicative DNA helicase